MIKITKRPSNYHEYIRFNIKAPKPGKLNDMNSETQHYSSVILQHHTSIINYLDRKLLRKQAQTTHLLQMQKVRDTALNPTAAECALFSSINRTFSREIIGETTKQVLTNLTL